MNEEEIKVMKVGKLISQGRGELWKKEDEEESERKEKMRKT